MLVAEQSVASLGTIADLALTAMSTIVAIVAVAFSHRQSVGWQPVVLLTYSGGERVKGQVGYTHHITFEVWNRRKYPISLSYLETMIPSGDIVSGECNGVKSSFITAGEFLADLNHVLGPANNFEINIKIDLGKGDFGDHDWTEIFVYYFDPYLNNKQKLLLTPKVADS